MVLLQNRRSMIEDSGWNNPKTREGRPVYRVHHFMPPPLLNRPVFFILFWKTLHLNSINWASIDSWDLGMLRYINHFSQFVKFEALAFFFMPDNHKNLTKSLLSYIHDPTLAKRGDNLTVLESNNIRMPYMYHINFHLRF